MNSFNQSKSGFTLAEVIIAMTISAFVLTASYAAIISLAKGSESMINYSEMNGQSRKAMEIFGRDARMAKDVNTFASSKVTMLREMWDSNTNSYKDRFVTYLYVQNAGIFSRQVNTVSIVSGAKVPGTQLSSEILLYDVDELSFNYYRLVDPDIVDYSPIAKSKLEVKHVQIEARIRRNVLRMQNTNYIISARFMMRNKDVSE